MIDIFQTLLKSRMGGLEEVEEMGFFFANVLYSDIIIYLNFYLTQLVSTNTKNSKAYKSGWIQPLYFYKLSGLNTVFSKENVDSLK